MTNDTAFSLAFRRTALALAACLIFVGIAGAAGPDPAPAPPPDPQKAEKATAIVNDDAQTAEQAEPPDEAETGLEGMVRAHTPDVALGGGHYVIRENEYHRGDFILFGGTIDVRGRVTGSLVLFGSQAEVTGTVGKDCVGIGSRVHLVNGAQIHGAVVNVLGRLDRGDEVTVGDEIVDLPFLDLSVFASGQSIVVFFLWLMFWVKVLKGAFLLLAVVLLTAIFTDRIAFAADVLPRAIGRSFLFGLLCWVCVVLAIILMAVTIIGIPFAILTGLAFKIVCWAGIAVVACAVGRNFGRNMLGRDIRPFAAALVGYLLLFVVYLIPFMGELIMGVVSVIGLGLLTITRLATREPGRNGLHAPFPSSPAETPPAPVEPLT